MPVSLKSLQLTLEKLHLSSSNIVLLDERNILK